jgi:hypothetical protein
MEINIEIKKRHAYLVLGFLIILVGAFVVNAFTDSNGVGHGAGQIGDGNFVGTASDKYTFPGNLVVDKALVVDKRLRVKGASEFTDVMQLPTKDSEPVNCNSANEGAMYVNTNIKDNTKLKLCRGSTWRNVN